MAEDTTTWVDPPPFYLAMSVFARDLYAYTEEDLTSFARSVANAVKARTNLNFASVYIAPGSIIIALEFDNTPDRDIAQAELNEACGVLAGVVVCPVTATQPSNNGNTDTGSSSSSNQASTGDGSGSSSSSSSSVSPAVVGGALGGVALVAIAALVVVHKQRMNALRSAAKESVVNPLFIKALMNNGGRDSDSQKAILADVDYELATDTDCDEMPAYDFGGEDNEEIQYTLASQEVERQKQQNHYTLGAAEEMYALGSSELGGEESEYALATNDAKPGSEKNDYDVASSNDLATVYSLATQSCEYALATNDAKLGSEENDYDVASSNDLAPVYSLATQSGDESSYALASDTTM